MSLSDTDLDTLETLAESAAGRHWRVCDDALSCGTSGVFHLLCDDPDGAACTVAASADVLETDRARLVYLAAAANTLPALIDEVRRLRGAPHASDADLPAGARDRL